MLKEIRFPDLGTKDAVPVAEIFVSEGERVEAEAPLLSLESDKAVMDIPAPFDALIKELKVKAGDRVKSGDLLALCETEEETDPPEAGGKAADEEPVADRQPPAESPADPAAAEPAAFPTTAAPASATPIGPADTGRSAAEGALPHASPSVRRFARELGADLRKVRGTAPKGRITRQDLQDYITTVLAASDGASSQAAVGPSPLPALPWIDPAEFGPVGEEPLSRIQKISGPRLHASWMGIPHVTQYEQADISYLERWRQELNEKGKEGVKFTILAFVVKALARAMEDYPRFNAALSPEGDRIIYRRYFHIGIAVDTPDGLLVPVLRDADKKNLSQIVREIKDLALRGRKGELKGDELKGAGMSVSNLGGIGGTAFTPIINPPETAILGLSRSAMQPIWNGSEFEPHLMLPLSLSYDHRVIDGAMAARFIRSLADLLEDVKKILI